MREGVCVLARHPQCQDRGEGRREAVRALQLSRHPIVDDDGLMMGAITPIKEEDISRFATDKDGVALVPIVNAGPHLLAVDYKVSPSKTPALADTDLYNATFSFVVDHLRSFDDCA